MTACQPTYVIVILDRVKAYCTGVSGSGKKLGRCCSPDGMIGVSDFFQPMAFTTVLIILLSAADITSAVGMLAFVRVDLHALYFTTPKPSATKNNNGELVGLELESAARSLFVEPEGGTGLVEDIFGD
ncbi:hypothetical protein GB937_008804 [Aspergillus fischeri]|nr:hypothetical protein GB937_008804 [Aspergillus fischeri]